MKFFGHGDLPASDLAGLLSECGYKGDELRDILNHAAETRPTPGGTDLRNHPSIVVRTMASVVRKPAIRPLVPERTYTICFSVTCSALLCLGFVASMGRLPFPPLRCCRGQVSTLRRKSPSNAHLPMRGG